MRTSFIAGILLLAHGLAAAGGYQQWQFGMSQAQVRAVGDPARYYAFKNGDVGAGSVPFEDGTALLSFYFTEASMQRAMLILYTGADAALARQAWATAWQHLTRVCGDVKGVSSGTGAITRDAALAAFDRDVSAPAPGQRHQMACVHMPAGERVWASTTHAEGNVVMVAVNYGLP